MQNWQYSQIVYQIFVDRFNRGKSFEEKVKKGLYGRDGGIVRKWEELPKRESHGLEFFGGDLEGIIEKIDYIKNLGINSIYLTPIFLAATNHKYDTHDFSVDPQFGDEQILAKLFEEAHKKEIRVILDGVFNHVGVDGIWFNKSKKYGNAGAYNDPRSPFKDFFEFKTWPNEYRSWIDIKLLPELNLQNETLRKLLFTDENSIIKRYLKMGADGWRLDCAHDLGHEINSLIVESARSVKTDAYVVGEVSGYPDEWLKLSKLDGVMNYYFSELLINTLNENFEPQLLKKGLDRMVEENGTASLSKSWNMLSSHDTPRMNSLLKDRMSKEIAIAFQIAYPGNPFLYYGEENGMNGDGDPDNRRPMVWDDKKWDWDFREFVIKAFDVRKNQPALNGGNYLKLDFKAGSPVVGFARYTSDPKDTLFFFANLSNSNSVEKIPVPFAYFMHHTQMERILGSGEAMAKVSEINFEMPSKSFGMFKFVPRFSMYRMYKSIK
ncbi:MAG: cyclomaltodextrinase [Athalassotoga sp.]|uniref:cyclomaltodextrinase n=1 Tax=Athalassotoga sp. TaxID=2022597 RepID=UPI003D010E15